MYTIENSAIIVQVLLTGLSAGLCFTWSNAVTPGIGKLNDIRFLQSFQQMNKAIINPTFLIVFFGPFLLNLINIYLFKSTSSTIMSLLIMAMAFYFLGVVLVTIFGNVPLNEMLDKIDLSTASIEELKNIREKFEAKWNRLHLIRTITSIISFLVLLISLIQISKNNI